MLADNTTDTLLKRVKIELAPHKTADENITRIKNLTNDTVYGDLSYRAFRGAVEFNSEIL